MEAQQRREGEILWEEKNTSISDSITTERAFLLTENRVLNEPLGRSLRLFACNALIPQRSALLPSLCSLTPFMGSLTHFAHSLVGQLKFMNMCSRCDRVTELEEQTRFWRSLETRPKAVGRWSNGAALSPFSWSISHDNCTCSHNIFREQRN